MLFMADTRTTYYVFGASPFYHDDSSKIQRTTMGPITGAGFCPLLDAVKGRLSKETITDLIVFLDVLEFQALS